MSVKIKIPSDPAGLRGVVGKHMLKIQDVARAMGVHPTYVTKLLREDRRLNPGLIKRLRNAIRKLIIEEP